MKPPRYEPMLFAPNFKTDPATMHESYQQLTGYKVPLTMERMFSLEMFCLKFSATDLGMLIRHIKSKGKRGRSLQFRHLIAGPESIPAAEEDLQEARVKWRKPMVNHAKDSVLRATGRAPEDHSAKVVTPAQVLAKQTAFENWKQSMKEQGLA